MLMPQREVRGPIVKNTTWLIEALRQVGCEVDVLNWGRHREREPLWEKAIGRIGDLRAIAKVIRRESYDLVVAQTTFDWASIIRDLPLAQLLGGRARLVAEFRGSETQKLVEPRRWLFKFAGKHLMRKVTAVFVLSEEERRYINRFRSDISVYVVQNPFIASPEPLRDADADPAQILFVGRLHQDKGILDLVDALPYLLHRTDCRLTLAGAGPHAPLVQQRASDLGVSDAVEYPGYLSGDGLTEAYARATVFAFPTFWTEGFPTVLSEAMAAGLPIVTTRLRGAADYLEDGINAIFVEPRDPMGVAAAVLRLLEDTDLRRRMSEANRRLVRSFDPPLVAQHFLATMEEVVRAAPLA
jgi:glycosyltransferase involved in cell wall biosynthesis